MQLEWSVDCLQEEAVPLSKMVEEDFSLDSEDSGK